MDATVTLEEFFQGHVDRALKEQGVETSPLTEHYVVRVLCTYANQPIDETPLAVRMLEALEASPLERRQHLRAIGDRTLYVSGFFAESFGRRAVDVDYYIGMGESAYGELVRSAFGWSRDPFADTYDELARAFPKFVRALAFVSRTVMPEPTPQDIVKLYERWHRSKSAWAKAQLHALGVILADDEDGALH